MTEQTTDTGRVEQTLTARSGPLDAPKQVSFSDLKDNDIVQVADMEVSFKIAKELGLIGGVTDEGLNRGSASQHTDKPEQKFTVVQKSETGRADYDETVDNLNAYVADGTLKQGEVNTYETSLAAVAMAGLDIEDAADTLAGLQDGSISELDVSADVQSMLTQTQQNIEQASTKAAMNELGKDAFDALSNLAASDPSVNDAIYRYARDRAQGKHGGVTWAMFYNEMFGL